MFAFSYPHSATLREDWEALCEVHPDACSKIVRVASRDIDRLAKSRLGNAIDVFISLHPGRLMKAPVLSFAVYASEPEHCQSQEWYDLVAELSEVCCIHVRTSRLSADKRSTILSADVSNACMFPGIIIMALSAWVHREAFAGLPVIIELYFTDAGDFDKMSETICGIVSRLVPGVEQVQRTCERGDAE